MHKLIKHLGGGGAGGGQLNIIQDIIYTCAYIKFREKA